MFYMIYGGDYDTGHVYQARPSLAISGRRCFYAEPEALRTQFSTGSEVQPATSPKRSHKGTLQRTRSLLTLLPR